VERPAPCQGFRFQCKTRSVRESFWIAVQCADNVPAFAVNKMGYMVFRKSWRNPALQTPVAKDKKKGKGKQPNLLPLPDKEQAKQEGKDDGKKNTGKVRQA